MSHPSLWISNVHMCIIKNILYVSMFTYTGHEIDFYSLYARCSFLDVVTCVFCSFWVRVFIVFTRQNFETKKCDILASRHGPRHYHYHQPWWDGGQGSWQSGKSKFYKYPSFLIFFTYYLRVKTQLKFTQIYICFQNYFKDLTLESVSFCD